MDKIPYPSNFDSIGKDLAIRNFLRFGMLQLHINVFAINCHAGEGLKIYDIRHAEGT